MKASGTSLHFKVDTSLGTQAGLKQTSDELGTDCQLYFSVIHGAAGAQPLLVLAFARQHVAGVKTSRLLCTLCHSSTSQMLNCPVEEATPS